MHILSRREAAAQAGFSVSTLKRLEADDDFPARVQVSPNRIGYVAGEVEHWIVERVAERDANDDDERPP